MTFSIEIVKEGFMSKKYAFPGRTKCVTRVPERLLPLTPVYTPQGGGGLGLGWGSGSSYEN